MSIISSSSSGAPVYPKDRRTVTPALIMDDQN